jgi:N4-gp56 family major capsid protein
MANDLITGMHWSSTLPSWQRDYYSLLLLETLRTKSILVPFALMKEDFAAANSGVVTFTEVYDTEPNWNPLSESDIWLRGSALDSRTINIQLEIHGDTLKFSDYNEIVQYVNAGNMRGLVKDKIGQNQVDYLDILARNAFLSHPTKNALISDTLTPGGARASITATDLFDPDLVETIRVHLEENEIPGVISVEDGGGETIVCATSPRVIKDIRTNPASKWLEVQEYAGSVRKFKNEVGMWGGVRFVKTNRLWMRNHGAVSNQDTLNGATVAGQGAAQTVDTVYTVGQSTSTRYITATDDTGFVVGDWITIHSQPLGTTVLESDGTQETRRIVSLPGSNQIVLNKPLLKPHADGDYITVGLDVHSSIFMGGPGVVYGVGERPNPVVPPKYDDLMMVNRYGWRGFLKFQLFRPEYYEVIETAGSTD